MYTIRESARAKHVRVTVYPDGEVVVTKPARVSEASVRRFVASRQEWIDETLEKFARRRKREAKNPPIELPRLRRGTKAYKEAVAQARKLVRERLAHYAPLYGSTYGTVAIRNQKTRWGSCTADGNLNFNYRLALVPSELADYVIVHELCHLAEHNHSARFWALVAETIPDYKERRKMLRRMSLE